MAHTQFIIREWPENLDFEQQTLAVPGSQKPGGTAAYRSKAFPELVTYGQPGQSCGTIVEAFEVGLARGKDHDCLGHRPKVSENPLKFADHYVFQTYGEVNERRLNLGSGIEALFRSGRAGGSELPTVGIWCFNRPEWQIIDLALHTFSKVGVSLYDTLGPDVVEYITNHAELTIAFVSEPHLPAMIAVAKKCPKLKIIVSIDELTPATRKVATAWATQSNVELLSMSELEAQGKENRLEPVLPGPDSIATICYTSGTTNVPKGALLSHFGLVSGAIAFTYGIPYKEGYLLGYLPLAHIYERVNEITVFLVGGGIGFSTGDPLRLMEDAQALKPSFFPGVPRVFNRIANGILAAAREPGLKGALLRKAIDVKLQNLRATGQVTHAVYDRLVFRKIRAMLGGKITSMTTGSAPINPDLLQLLNVAFCVPIIEGWGMTEGCAAGTRVLPGDPSSAGTVGTCHPCNEVKLLDVPEMGYLSTDKPYPRGELLTRGPNIFKGYYKDPTNTKAALDEEGWMHSGDVAEMDGKGRFKIIDRVKNIMKLSQGEYVALEKIENSYNSCPIVQQLYVHGDSLQDHLIGILIPEPPVLAEVIKKQLGPSALKGVKLNPTNPSVLALDPETRKNLEKLVQDPKVQKGIQGLLDHQAKHLKLRGFEVVKRVHITFDAFTPDNNMLTPTLKLRRRDIQAKYKPVLNQIYEEDKIAKDAQNNSAKL